ncbi:MAG: hypothetical protein E6R03_12855 [Hyphomicrobiaceae bacterium]|nr:MAG: hypothetical protein E6R03_12855 [Hyphomicrobiaceae bacterium]
MKKQTILPSEIKPSAAGFRNRQGCYHKHRHTYNRTILELLENADNNWQVTGQALRQLLDALEVRLAQAYLPPDRWAEVDYDARVIRVATDLEAQLHHPDATQRVLIESIAHELAHVVLKHKPGRDGLKKANWEVEATVWAYQFLVPWFLIEDRPEIRAIRKGGVKPNHQLAYLYDLADWLGVTVSFLQRALELYGILEYGALEFRKSARPRSGPDKVRYLLEDSRRAVNA